VLPSPARQQATRRLSTHCQRHFVERGSIITSCYSRLAARGRIAAATLRLTLSMLSILTAARLGLPKYVPKSPLSCGGILVPHNNGSLGHIPNDSAIGSSVFVEAPTTLTNRHTDHATCVTIGRAICCPAQETSILQQHFVRPGDRLVLYSLVTVVKLALSVGRRRFFVPLDHLDAFSIVDDSRTTSPGRLPQLVSATSR